MLNILIVLTKFLLSEAGQKMHASYIKKKSLFILEKKPPSNNLHLFISVFLFLARKYDCLD